MDTEKMNNAENLGGDNALNETVEIPQADQVPGGNDESTSTAEDGAPKDKKNAWCLEFKDSFDGSNKHILAFGELDKESAERFAAQVSDKSGEGAVCAAKTPTRVDVVRTHETDSEEKLVIEEVVSNGARWDEAQEMVSANPSLRVVRRSRTPKIIAAACAVAVVALIGAGSAIALSQPSQAAPEVVKTPSQTAPVTTASEKSDAQSEVKVTIIAEGAGDTATKAKVSVADADGKTVVKETEVVANTETSLGDLVKGDYVLTVSVAPVLEDGSTYTLPAEPTKFSVDGHGKAVKVESALSKHAKEDMSAEELKAAAAELEAVGNTAAAANVADAAQNAAPSQGNTGSAGGSNVPSNNGGSSGGNSGNSGGAGSTPAPEQPAPAPEPPAPEPPAVEPEPDPEPPARESYSVWITSDGREFLSAEECSAWKEQNALNGNRLTNTVVTRYR